MIEDGGRVGVGHDVLVFLALVFLGVPLGFIVGVALAMFTYR